MVSTPTGSTAYTFSAGGPVVWPGVEAMLMVPISAHALFARPLVVGPTSVLAVEVLDATDAHGRAVVRRPARRSTCRPGARIEVTPRRARCGWSGCTEAPFTDRLVAKFGLPVEGWRGPADRRHRGDAMLEEIRIAALGVIERGRARAAARPDRDHR